MDKEKKIFYSSDLDLRDLVLRLEEAGEDKLAEELLNDYVSSEQAHKMAMEDMAKRTDSDVEEDTFIPPVDSFHAKVIEALNKLYED